MTIDVKDQHTAEPVDKLQVWEESIKDILKTFHRSSCYPHAQDYEVHLTYEKINSLMYDRAAGLADPAPNTGLKLITEEAYDALVNALTLVRDRFFPVDQCERDQDELWPIVNDALNDAAITTATQEAT